MFLLKISDSKYLISLRYFLKDKIIWISGTIGLLINVLLWILLYFKMPQTEGIVPLHYNIYFGIDKVGPWYGVFIFPFTGFFIWLINFCLAYIFYKKEKFLSHFLVIVAVLAEIIIAGASLIVLRINI